MLVAITAWLLVRTASGTSAQDSTATHPLLPSDTSSYQATLNSFLNACNELYELAETEQSSEDFTAKILPAAERIKDCLDLSELPIELRDTVGVESGVYLERSLGPHRVARR